MPDPELIPPRSGRRFFTTWTMLWIAAWVGLFVVMHTPVPAGRRLPQHGDKVLHFCAYCALALMGARSSLSRQVDLTPRWLIKWLLVYIAYGAADELLQGLVNRSPSMMDWAADVAGAAAALGIVYLNRPGQSEPDEP